MRDTVASDTPSTAANTRWGSSRRPAARMTPFVTTAASAAVRGDGRVRGPWRVIAIEILSLFSFCSNTAPWGQVPKLVPGDGLEMHLVRPVGQPERARVGPGVGQERVLADAGGTMRLNRAIEHALRDVRRHDFDHRNLGARRLVAYGVHQVRRTERQ